MPAYTTADIRNIAFAGHAHSGKTTLVNLIARLFDATEGTVLVDGVDVRELDPVLLWGRIGYVPQRGYLFSGTVRSNLMNSPSFTPSRFTDTLRDARPSTIDCRLSASLLTRSR